MVPCREISLSRLHEETVIRQGEPELKLAVVSLVGPSAADPQCVSVWLDDLLRLEIGPKVFQRWDVDRRELIVAQPESLAGLSCEEYVCASLHLDCSPTEVPDGETVEDARLAGVVALRAQPSWVRSEPSRPSEGGYLTKT